MLCPGEDTLEGENTPKAAGVSREGLDLKGLEDGNEGWHACSQGLQHPILFAPSQ